jgi:hypothetical protein
MKKLIFTVLAISALASDYANAQQKRATLTNSANRHEHLRQRFRGPIVRNKLAAKTTATDVRLIAQTSLEHDGTAFQLIDSTTFSYVGSRGGTYDDMWQSWNWDMAGGYYYEYNGTAYDPASTKYTATYNTAGELDYYIVQDWNSTTSAWENSYKSSFTYDAAGNVLTNTEYDWNSTSGTWDNSYRTTNTYTATNRQATSIQEQWDATAGAWENSSKNINTWSAADKLTNILWQFWSGSSWQDGFRTSYSYDGSGNRTEGIGELWNSAASTWDTSGKDVFTGFAGLHQPLQVTTLTYNNSTSTFENNSRVNYTYNSYNKPTYEYEEIWNETSGAWGVDTYSYATRYHYETYTTSTTNVDEVTSAKDKAIVYPVPASANINIAVTWGKAQRYTATIADATGRTYIIWTSPTAAITHQETIAVDNLPPGNYVLTLQGETERAVKQFTVVR